MPRLMAACGSASETCSPAPGDVPLVGLVRTGEDLDQGRLAGAVLAEQAVHLAGADVEVDAVEGADARELLDDAVHLEQRSGARPRRAAVTHAHHQTFAHQR